MPPVQTTYTERMPVAFEGMAGDMETWDADSRLCETAAGINFGRAVAQGTAAKGAVLGGALNAFVGITLKDVTLAASQADKYAQRDLMAVLYRGTVWVKPVVAVAAGDPVHYSTTTGELTNTGGIGPIPGATYIIGNGGVAGALALVRLSGHMPA